jgi:hypothetical protein
LEVKRNILIGGKKKYFDWRVKRNVLIGGKKKCIDWR